MASAVEAIELGDRSISGNGHEIRASSVLPAPLAVRLARRALVTPEEWIEAHKGRFPDPVAVSNLVGPRVLSGTSATYADFLDMIAVPEDLPQADSTNTV